MKVYEVYGGTYEGILVSPLLSPAPPRPSPVPTPSLSPPESFPQRKQRNRVCKSAQMQTPRQFRDQTISER